MLLYSNFFLPFLISGYIPKNQHYFAKRYGEVCRSAIYHHEIDQQKNKQLRNENNHRLTWKVKSDATETSPQKTVSRIYFNYFLTVNLKTSYCNIRN